MAAASRRTRRSEVIGRGASSVSSPILAWRDFTSIDGVLAPVPAADPKTGSPFLKLHFPLRDLVGVNVEMLSQLGYRVLAPDGRQRHLCLEGRCVGPACALAHRIS
jgi:hypothetical protein